MKSLHLRPSMISRWGGLVVLAWALAAVSARPARAVDFFKDPKANKEAVMEALSAASQIFSTLQLLDSLIVGTGPSLTDLLLEVKTEIIEEIRDVRNDEFNTRAIAALRNYQEMPFHQEPLKTERFADWLNETQTVVAGLENILLNEDLQSARQLAPIFNVLVAARAKALAEWHQDQRIIDHLFNIALRANHRLVGGWLSFEGGACYNGPDFRLCGTEGHVTT
jgi:hypothetical protein